MVSIATINNVMFKYVFYIFWSGKIWVWVTIMTSNFENKIFSAGTDIKSNSQLLQFVPGKNMHV